MFKKVNPSRFTNTNDTANSYYLYEEDIKKKHEKDVSKWWSYSPGSIRVRPFDAS